MREQELGDDGLQISRSRAMSRRFRKACFAALTVVVIGGILAGYGFASGSRVQTLHFITVSQHRETLDFPPRGKSPGDLYVFDATIVAANGHTVIGRERGTETSIKVEHGVETLQGMTTYELGSGNEIVVGGLAANPLGGRGLIKGKSFVRAVLGGTGRYTGAKGTETAKRLSGNRYDHVLKLTY
jgi:hypothetical protein